MATLAEGDAGEASGMPRLQEADAAASLRPEGNKAVMEASNKYLVLLGHEDAPSAELAQEAPPADKEGKGKLPAKEGDKQA